MTHFFTLYAVCRELHKNISGSTILEVFTQQKHELIISLDQGTTQSSLNISVNPNLNYIFLRDHISRAKRNSVNLFEPLNGAVISEVTLYRYDRVVRLICTNGLSLYALLYNTAASNIVLTNEQLEIIEAFKHNRDKQNTRLILTKECFNENLLCDFNLFKTKLLESKDENIFQRLKTMIPILGSTISREVLHRAHIGEQSNVCSLNDNDCESLFKYVCEVFDDLESPQPKIYFRGETPRIFSVIPLRHLAGSKTESFETANNGLCRFLGMTLHYIHSETEKKVFSGKLKNQLVRLNKSVNTIREELNEASSADNYERIGKIIMANLQHLTKGTKEIDLPDIFSDNKSVRIKMNPKLTPVKNAEVYFEKAKRAKTARMELEKRFVELNNKVSQLKKMLLHLDGCQTKEQIEEFKSTYHDELVNLNILPKKQSEIQPPFRIFKLEGNYEVWVGKSGANNDLLTMKYAKPNDLWFHVRGASGSHTILKISSSKTTPSKLIIKKAAAIAAYYSKMRKAGNVPVSYCERKYVRKPKGTAEGTVFLEREKIIFVDPQLPN